MLQKLAKTKVGITTREYMFTYIKENQVQISLGKTYKKTLKILLYFPKM